MNKDREPTPGSVVVAGDRKEKDVEQNLGGTTGQTGNGMQGTQVTEQAKQQGQHLAQQARQQATELANRGTEQVKSQLESQKHQAAQRMTPVQMALRETAQQLRRQGEEPVAGYADSASDQVERFSGYLRETEVDEIVDEVRGFARSRPALFLGSAALLGFVGTRFLKSSSQGGASARNDEPVTALPPAPAEDAPLATGRALIREADRSVPPRDL
jgi:hypothetical protein